MLVLAGMYDAAGKTRAMLAVDADGTPMLGMNDAPGRTRAVTS